MNPELPTIFGSRMRGSAEYAWTDASLVVSVKMWTFVGATGKQIVRCAIDVPGGCASPVIAIWYSDTMREAAEMAEQKLTALADALNAAIRKWKESK